MVFEICSITYMWSFATWKRYFLHHFWCDGTSSYSSLEKRGTWWSREVEMDVSFRVVYIPCQEKFKNWSKVEGSIVAHIINEETSNLAEYYFPSEGRTKSWTPAHHDDGGVREMYYVYISKFPQKLDDLVKNQRTNDLLRRRTLICKYICSPTVNQFLNMRGIHKSFIKLM